MTYTKKKLKQIQRRVDHDPWPHTVWFRALHSRCFCWRPRTLVAHFQPRWNQKLGFAIYKELVEINTATATGDTAAARCMAARLLAAGFAAEDVQVFKPASRKGDLVARLRGSGSRERILLLAHLDVVPAKREDWSTDPFKLVGAGRLFLSRKPPMTSSWLRPLSPTLSGTSMRIDPVGHYRRHLETDEEILDANRLGINWLLANHRDLIDAEFALNQGGGVGLKAGKPSDPVQTSGEILDQLRAEVRNKGGHGSLPTKDNAIYRLASGTCSLVRVQLSREVQRNDAGLF